MRRLANLLPLKEAIRLNNTDKNNHFNTLKIDQRQSVTFSEQSQRCFMLGTLLNSRKEPWNPMVLLLWALPILHSTEIPP